MVFRIIIICLLSITLYSCQKKKEIIYEPQKKISAFKLYEEGLNAFEKNDFFYASKKFSEAELNFENIELAAKSAIMAAYSLYGINFYEESLKNLENYLKIYPADQNVIYAHFLIAVIYFEQISDEKKDINPLLKAKNKIRFFLNKYPNTDYAIDLKFKKDLINNQLASKEMYIAKYYIATQKWIPAINRLKVIVNDFSETVFIEEALHRLVEVYYRIGLTEEAKAAAAILGYNYNSSEWYTQSYKILDKTYKLPKKSKTQKNDGLIKRTIKRILN